jgi:hypothetical protein
VDAVIVAIPVIVMVVPMDAAHAVVAATAPIPVAVDADAVVAATATVPTSRE